jgi:transketolase
LQEGQNWEANMYASAKVDNIIYNRLTGKQIDGSTDEVLAMGVSVLSLKLLTGCLDEKNDIEAIIAGMNDKIKNWKRKTSLYVVHTEMGNGVDYMMYSHAWHGKAPNDAQLKIIRSKSRNDY